ncbi:MAG: hypothetical protein ACXACG_16290, partial [Candidatus Thorarchaeota archaeon]
MDDVWDFVGDFVWDVRYSITLSSLFLKCERSAINVHISEGGATSLENTCDMVTQSEVSGSCNLRIDRPPPETTRAFGKV